MRMTHDACTMTQFIEFNRKKVVLRFILLCPVCPTHGDECFETAPSLQMH